MKNAKLFTRLWLAASFFCVIAIPGWSQSTADTDVSEAPTPKKTRHTPFTLGVAGAGYFVVREGEFEGTSRMFGITGQHHFRMYSGNPFISWTVGYAHYLPVPYGELLLGTYLGRRDWQPFVSAGASSYPHYYLVAGGMAFRKRILFSGVVYTGPKPNVYHGYKPTYSLRLSLFPRFRHRA